jgi:hypothetical protein
MMLRPLNLVACFICISFLVSCFDFRQNDLIGGGSVTRPEAYVPVYDTDSSGSRVVSAVAARPIRQPGKIYVQDNLLFQVEKLAGVHIIDYSNPAQPVKLGFIKSRGCSEVAYKNGYLIINNLNDLVFVDIRNVNEVKEATRIPNAFPQFYVDQFFNNRPPEAGKFYVCPDFNRGDIIDWKLEKNVQGADCY